jgi:hypothetical protein
LTSKTSRPLCHTGAGSLAGSRFDTPAHAYTPRSPALDPLRLIRRSVPPPCAYASQHCRRPPTGRAAYTSAAHPPPASSLTPMDRPPASTRPPAPEPTPAPRTRMHARTLVCSCACGSRFCRHFLVSSRLSLADPSFYPDSTNMVSPRQLVTTSAMHPPAHARTHARASRPAPHRTAVAALSPSVVVVLLCSCCCRSSAYSPLSAALASFVCHSRSLYCCQPRSFVSSCLVF